jgi:hypothetical protein
MTEKGCTEIELAAGRCKLIKAQRREDIPIDTRGMRCDGE